MRPISEQPAPRPARGAPRVSKDRNSRRVANYVIGIVLVAVLGVVALVIVRSLDGDDGGGLTIVTLDVRSGEVTLLDASGEPIEDAPAIDGDGLQLTFDARGSHVLARAEADTWQSIDVTDGEAVTIPPPSADPDSVVVRWAHEREAVTVSSDQNLGNIVLTDVATSDEIDVGAEAGIEDPIISGDVVHSTEDASVFGVTDLSDTPLTTILVGFERETVTMQGQLVGLDGDGAAVLDRRRASERLVFYDLGGEERSAVDLSRTAFASMNRDGSVNVISEDGRVQRASRGEDALEELDPIDLGEADTLDRVSRLGNRLVVTSDRNTITVIDESGETVLARRGEIDRRTFGPMSPNARAGPGCLLISEGEDALRQYELDGGEELTAEPLPGPVVAVAPDRCGFTTRSGVVVRGDAVGEARETLRAVSPDGDLVVTGTRDGQLLLRRLDESDAAAVELPGQAVVFATR